MLNHFIKKTGAKKLDAVQANAIVGGGTNYGGNTNNRPPRQKKTWKGTDTK